MIFVSDRTSLLDMTKFWGRRVNYQYTGAMGFSTLPTIKLWWRETHTIGSLSTNSTPPSPRYLPSSHIKMVNYNIQCEYLRTKMDAIENLLILFIMYHGLINVFSPNMYVSKISCSAQKQQQLPNYVGVVVI